MAKKTYIKLMDFLKSHKAFGNILRILYYTLPLVMVIAYPLMLLLKAQKGLTRELLLMVITPAVVLAGVYVMRLLINRQRPYEKFKTASFISKDKCGKSFPSNHSACSVIIAITGFCINIYLGLALMVIALIIALSRILSGVHFISDVLAGILISLLLGCMYIIL